MMYNRLTVHQQERLGFILMFFEDLGRFSGTAQEIYEATRARYIFDMDSINSYFQEALKYGFVSKCGDTFTLTLDKQMIEEVIANRENDKKVYVANMNASIVFLKSYVPPN